MSEVEVTPDELRAAGTTIGGIYDWSGESAVNDLVSPGLPYAVNDTGRLSGGFFEASLGVDHHLDRITNSTRRAVTQISQNLGALASALHIVADVYESADLEEALKFAWNEVDTVPPGLSPLIDPDQVVTLDSNQELSEPPGGADPGSMGGNNGHPPKVETFAPGYDVTTYYDSNGNVVREVHVLTNQDGSTEIHTFEDGETTVEQGSPAFSEAINRKLEEALAPLQEDLESRGLDANLPTTD